LSDDNKEMRRQNHIITNLKMTQVNECEAE